MKDPLLPSRRRKKAGKKKSLPAFIMGMGSAEIYSAKRLPAHYHWLRRSLATVLGMGLAGVESEVCLTRMDASSLLLRREFSPWVGVCRS
jgi:hypothetical protein